MGPNFYVGFSGAQGGRNLSLGIFSEEGMRQYS